MFYFHLSSSVLSKSTNACATCQSFFDKIWFVQSTFESTLKKNYKFEGQRLQDVPKVANWSTSIHSYPLKLPCQLEKRKIDTNYFSVWITLAETGCVGDTIGKILSDTRARLGVKINVLATSTTRLQPWKRDHHPMEKFLVPKCRKISHFRQNKLLTN